MDEYSNYLKSHRAMFGHETKAKKILRMCGVRMAALYLKNRGYTAEQAVTLLFR